MDESVLSKKYQLGLLLNSSLMRRRILYTVMEMMRHAAAETKGMSLDEVREWMRGLTPEVRENLHLFSVDIHKFAATWKMSDSAAVANFKDAIGYDPEFANKTPDILRMCYKYTTDDGSVGFMNVVSRASVKADSGIAVIGLNYSFVPYLINIMNNTQLPLRDTIGFTTVYSFAMFEFLTQWCANESEDIEIKIPLAELHSVLDTNDVASYKVWSVLKTKVLDHIVSDFDAIGGGYGFEFVPAYSAGRVSKGRPKVEYVVVRFKDNGYTAFKNLSAL